MKEHFIRWRANFFAGLAVVLPAVISIAILVMFFGTVANITDTLLFFLPRGLTHQLNGQGPMHWYWSLAAFSLAVVLIIVIGGLARNYFGNKMIQVVDHLLLQIPLLNKIYAAIKQVNEAFTSTHKSSFKQVVLVEFPRAGQHAVGFITGDNYPEIAAKTGQKIVGVYVPTAPNPTAGFLVMVPESEVISLDMSVADGIKFVISLGAIAPEYVATDKMLKPSK